MSRDELRRLDSTHVFSRGKKVVVAQTPSQADSAASRCTLFPAAVIGDTDIEEEPSALNFDFSNDEGEPFRGPAVESVTIFIAWRGAASRAASAA